MTKRLCVVTILFCIFIISFSCFCFADSENDIDVIGLRFYFSSRPTNYELFSSGFNYADQGNEQYVIGFNLDQDFFMFAYNNKAYVVSTSSASSYYTTSGQANAAPNSNSPLVSIGTYNRTYNLYYTSVYSFSNASFGIPVYLSIDSALSDIRDYIDNPPAPTPTYTKNANVDEFIANTLISMGIHYNQYSNALSIASSAWNYIIDDSNWYIGTGDRNDKDIKWNIETAVSYANAQSNNYKDWYNGYKVNKDLTIALAKFISDNYTASTVGEGTLAGYSVKYNSNYNYGTTTGTSGFSGSFGSSPNALSFYPASTITYFNGAFLHDNDIIDQDEFVYSPPDVRKFIGYPSTSGIIDSPDNTPASGTITDGNGDTVYNIDLDFPSLDWLANAIQSLLDFLDRLITTIADFLTQILDAILSLFSDAFESLTAFGQGLIEWIYSVVGSFGTLGSNYIPASLWTVLLPFIFLNIGVGLILFVLRSH